MTALLMPGEGDFIMEVCKLANERGITPARSVELFGMIARIAVQTDVKNGGGHGEALDFHMRAFARGFGVDVQAVDVPDGPLQ